jgi:hypothetical protein
VPAAPTIQAPEPDAAIDHGAAKQRSGARLSSVLVVAVIALGAFVAVRAFQQSDRATPRPPAGHPDRFIPPRLARENAIPVRGYAARRRHLDIDGVRFSFDVPTQGWQSYGRVSVSLAGQRTTDGSGLVFWTGFPDARATDPCLAALDLPARATPAQLLEAMVHAPGVAVLRRATEATVGGWPARSVELRVVRDAGCDPGYFFSWRDGKQGSLWPGTSVGDTIRIWLVDVAAGRHLVVEAQTTKDAGPELEREVDQIVTSMRFA